MSDPTQLELLYHGMLSSITRPQSHWKPLGHPVQTCSSPTKSPAHCSGSYTRRQLWRNDRGSFKAQSADLSGHATTMWGTVGSVSKHEVTTLSNLGKSGCSSEAVFSVFGEWSRQYFFLFWGYILWTLSCDIFAWIFLCWRLHWIRSWINLFSVDSSTFPLNHMKMVRLSKHAPYFLWALHIFDIASVAGHYVILQDRQWHMQPGLDARYFLAHSRHWWDENYKNCYCAATDILCMLVCWIDYKFTYQVQFFRFSLKKSPPQKKKK